MRACKTCDFIGPWNDVFGRCHRFPPPFCNGPIADDADYNASCEPNLFTRPCVDFDDWCGEWKGRADIKEKSRASHNTRKPK